ncbi:MAG: aspartyl-tRNA(Asn)/glutamyl-tRNA(Gln) amidotransferase subunit A [Gammaproteobacteria bacterium]|jgi:aspartyl-tRNA(Asn)/glutamyl-tRNA(Gln) amidotransferase subunit A
MSIELGFASIAMLASRIEQRALSPVELTEALLARIDALEPKLNAFITHTGERALGLARAAERDIANGHWRGPMHGSPFGLKDIYETAGILTSAHSQVLRDNVPTEDATTTARLYAAEGVLFEKLATHEFAHGGPSFDLPWPPARNPWELGHVTGGSSSGSAAAVAAGLLPVALGSDTGGSIRGPAGLCGLVGLKPTYGLVSRHGIIANSYSYDHAGPLTRGVEDAAIVLQVLAGHDANDPASAIVEIPDYSEGLHAGLGGMRIGVIRHFSERDQPVTNEVAQAMEAAIAVFQRLGAVLEDVELRPLEIYQDIKVTQAEPEVFSIHQNDLRGSSAGFGFL